MRWIKSTRAGRLSITRGQLADGLEVLELIERVHQEERYFVAAADELGLTPESQGRLMEQLNRADNSCFLVGRTGGHIVGVVRVTGGSLRRLRHVGRLEIYVDQPARGGGVGRALAEVAIQWCEECPALHKLALAVFEDNARAVALYRSLGFEDEGRRLGEYRERDGRLRSDLLMYRLVQSPPSP